MKRKKKFILVNGKRQYVCDYPRCREMATVDYMENKRFCHKCNKHLSESQRESEIVTNMYHTVTTNGELPERKTFWDKVLGFIFE